MASVIRLPTQSLSKLGLRATVWISCFRLSIATGSVMCIAFIWTSTLRFKMNSQSFWLALSTARKRQGGKRA